MTALQDKIAIVSGAGRGTGRALALKLAAAGARVVVNDVSEAPAAEVVQTICDAGGDAVLCAGDITAADFGGRFVAKALETFGGLDIVINNASYVWPAMIDDMTDEQFIAMVDVNMTAPFRILRAAARFFKSEAARAARRRSQSAIERSNSRSRRIASRPTFNVRRSGDQARPKRRRARSTSCACRRRITSPAR